MSEVTSQIYGASLKTSYVILVVIVSAIKRGEQAD